MILEHPERLSPWTLGQFAASATRTSSSTLGTSVKSSATSLWLWTRRAHMAALERALQLVSVMRSRRVHGNSLATTRSDISLASGWKLMRRTKSG